MSKSNYYFIKSGIKQKKTKYQLTQIVGDTEVINEEITKKMYGSIIDKLDKEISLKLNEDVCHKEVDEESYQNFILTTVTYNINASQLILYKLAYRK